MLEVVGQFVEHLVGVSKNNGLKTHFNTNPTPYKKSKNPT
jgi:hypothetical protein